MQISHLHKHNLLVFFPIQGPHPGYEKLRGRGVLAILYLKGNVMLHIM